MIKLQRDAPTQREFTYILPNMASFSYELNAPVTPTPLPEERAEDNVLIKMEGNSSKISLRWRVKIHDGSLVSETNVKTLREQLAFFKNQFIPYGIEDSYQLIINFDDTDTNDTGDNKIVFDGTFTKFRFDTTSTQPVTFNMSADFLEGTVASVHDIDVPSEPLNVESSVSGNAITIRWEPPQEEDDITITGYTLRYRRTKESPTDWINVSSNIGATVRSYIADGLPDGTYLFELTPRSASGNGRTSREIEVVDTS